VGTAGPQPQAPDRRDSQRALPGKNRILIGGMMLNHQAWGCPIV
jgi:hypothetical protein